MAAEEGDPQAQFNLGRLCYEGAPEESSGASFTDAFEQDHAEAALWLQKAVDQGHAEAAGLLEVVRAQGKGVH
jgi:TPR repeat protein